MSDGTAAEYSAAETAAELPANGDTAFAELMGILVPQPDGEADGQGNVPAGTPAAGDGSPAAAAEGAGAGDPAPATPTAGDDSFSGVAQRGAGDTGGSEGGAGTDTGANAPGPGAGALDAADLTANWGAVKTGLETRMADQLENAAVAEIKQEYARYFEAIGQHPRELVGAEVPSITKPGEMETLRDSADAREWQDAVKVALQREAKDRADRKADDTRILMTTLTSSIGVFEKNPDLVPRTKQFNKEFADKVGKALAPYTVKDEAGKALGWSIDVQPIIETIRETLAPAPAPAPAPAGTGPTPAQQRAAEQPRDQVGRFDAPQAGIPSKSGASGAEAEDFSTLFGTLGMPGLRI